MRTGYVASLDSPTFRVTTGGTANAYSCIVDGERYDYTRQVRDTDFQQQACQIHLVALVFRRSFESQPNPGLGSHLPAEIPALSTLSGESILRHLKFYAMNHYLAGVERSELSLLAAIYSLFAFSLFLGRFSRN